VVLCAERDLPIPAGGYRAGVLPVVQRLTAQRVTRALAAFEHVTLIGCGDHGIPGPVWRHLAAAADTVIDRSDAVGTPGVTTLGPTTPATSALVDGAVTLAPRLFGRHTPRFLATARRCVRLARRVRAGPGRPPVDAPTGSGRSGPLGSRGGGPRCA
jgi:hypothetical protein